MVLHLKYSIFLRSGLRLSKKDEEDKEKENNPISLAPKLYASNPSCLDAMHVLPKRRASCYLRLGGTLDSLIDTLAITNSHSYSGCSACTSITWLQGHRLTPPSLQRQSSCARLHCSSASLEGTYVTPPA